MWVPIQREDRGVMIFTTKYGRVTWSMKIMLTYGSIQKKI